MGGNRTGGNLLESHDDDNDDIGGGINNIDDIVEVPSSYPCREE